MDNVRKESMGKLIVPDWKTAFFQLVKLRPQDVRVIILGREAECNSYATPNGMAYSDSSLFSGITSIPSPKSAALLTAWASDPENDGKPIKHANLKKWVDKGVLLWNCIPFAKQDSPGRLIGFGWESLTKQMIEVIRYESPNAIFVLPKNIPATYWASALQYSNSRLMPPPIESWRNTEQMSELIRYRLFTRINTELRERNHQPINWEI